MCIRDSINAEYGETSVTNMVSSRFDTLPSVVEKTAAPRPVDNNGRPSIGASTNVAYEARTNRDFASRLAGLQAAASPVGTHASRESDSVVRDRLSQLNNKLNAH
eukprot:TRINITY_DN15873_c0_g1_i1.p1 TRINITY_DN15873_c0_g1~~TRINITY_DN15873_c0_g1_i1.p1  ORF type:complete len:105 (+),score=18.40 TRINITY_DN15873_c0_g1_i1:138-452(+)